MLNNEKQLKYILQKLITENYKKVLLKEMQSGEVETKKADKDKQTTPTNANANANAGEPTAPTSVEPKVSETAPAKETTPTEEPTPTEKNNISLRYCTTDANDTVAIIDDLKPGQIKLIFKKKNNISKTPTANVVGDMKQVNSNANDTYAMIKQPTFDFKETSTQSKEEKK